VASQFHPEFKSRPDRPHPLFDGFVTAAIAVRDGRQPELRPRSADRPATPRPEPAITGIPVVGE